VRTSLLLLPHTPGSSLVLTSVLKYPVVLLLALRALFADDAVKVQFNPQDPQTGPFPADSLTLPDSAQITGKRVNLPLPDCPTFPALCTELTMVNQLDGFNVQPRISVTFSGPIDASTLRSGIFFVALDNLTSDEIGLQKPGDTIAINQVVWDPATNSAYAKPDAALDQHRRYALLVTDAIHDMAGNPVAADPAFTACLQTSDASGYCLDLAQAVTAAPVPRGANVVSASIFTTLSATAWMQSARLQLQGLPVVVRHPDSPYVFNVSDISNLTVNFDVGSGNFTGFSLPLGSPAYSVLFSNLGRLAFGSFLSPQVLNWQQTIDPSPTGMTVALPTPLNEVAFHVYLPNTPPPPNGYPVVILGHGFGDSSVGAPTVISPSLAQAGFASIAINAFGHGFGPQSSVVLTGNSGASTTILLGGRGIDRNGDGVIDSTEGCLILTPNPVGLRDCLRQTVVDLMQLVRVIQAGLDVDGDGVVDLDAGHIYYVGQSLGSIYGTLLHSVEPAIRAAVLNVGGGSVSDIVRWSPDFSSTAASILTSQNPPLLPPGTPFNDNFPFRDQPVSINVPGNSDTQYYMEIIEWLDNPGDPIPFAPHLARSTLPGVPAKPVLFQMARADRTIPNPAASDLIRAAGMAGSTWMYRHDLAEAAYPGLLPENPHPYLALFLGANGGTVSLPSLPALLIGLATQSQVGGFLASDGASIPDMNQIFPGPLFEIPATLPNDLGYAQ
jgi:hypothetical protein